MIKRSLAALLIVGLMGLSALAGYYVQQRQQTAAVTIEAEIPVTPLVNRSVEGTPVPAFSLPDLDGAMRDLSEWQGKVIAINFWATWCPPCLKEIPEFVQLQSLYGEQGLQFLGIALQSADEVRDFVREYAMNYPVLTGELEVIKLAESLGNQVGGLPYTVILDRTGTVRFIKAGALSRSEAESAITALL